MSGSDRSSAFICPATHSPLHEADAQLIARINRAIAAGRVKNQAGRVVEQPLDGALLREDRAIFYPILDGIPILLSDEAIRLDQIV